MDGKLIYEQIPKIMEAVEPISKGRQNLQQGYKYRGVDDVMNALSMIMAKHQVFPVIRALDTVVRETVTSKSGASGIHHFQQYECYLYAADGSYISAIHEGEAIDYGDKSAGKASSYAYRDFLLKTFCIPTEGDNDTDAYDHHIEPRQTVKPQEYQKPKLPGKISEAQAKRIFALASAKHGESGKEIVKATLKRYGYDHSVDVDMSVYEQICQEVQE